MPSVGIIAEYNPFHNGHFEQIKNIKKLLPDATIIAIMSGSIVQRGEIAFFDKWVRATSAISGGVDLVLELPSVFAIRSAEHFALGGVSLLNRLKIVDFLAFSAENPSEELLARLARLSSEEKIQDEISSLLAKGYSYAYSIGKALTEKMGLDPQIIRSPNNILAIEYLKALQKTKSTLKPLILPRRGTHHSSLDIKGKIVSSTAIREFLKNNAQNPNISMPILEKCIPEKSFSILKPLIEKEDFPRDDYIFLPLIVRLNFALEEELKKIYGFEKGLDNRLKRCMDRAKSLRELLNLATSKRYQKSRLQRFFIYVLLGMYREEIISFDKNGPLYARILAFNDRGRALLRHMKDATDFPLLTRIAQKIPRSSRFQSLPPMERMLALDTFATDLEGFTHRQKKSVARDFFFAPLYRKTE